MSQKVIYDVIHGNIELSGFESILLKSPIVNRLHQVLQNSTAYNVFPNLKASRFEHSLGVMNYSGKMYNSGLINADAKLSSKFLDHKRKLVINLIENNYKNIFKRLTTEGKSINPYKKYLHDELKLSKDWSNVSKVISSAKFKENIHEFFGNDFCNRAVSNTSAINLLLFQGVRLFGLLHDIGHLPLSHLFEYSIDSVYLALADMDEEDLNESQKSYKLKLEKLLKVPDEDFRDQIHEKIGKNVTTYLFQDVRLRIFENNKYKNNKKAIFIFIVFILELLWNEIILGRKGQLFSIYTIVSGTIDSDRMDYVRRDGTLSGIAKASANFNRIVEMYCLSKKPEKDSANDPFLFMPSIQSLSDVEELLHQRFRIYKYMVNHHAVARSNYIFQKVIQNQILKEIESDFTNSNPTGSALSLNSLSSVIDIAVDIINKDGLLGDFYNTMMKFVQLTDFWLLSILNKEFISTSEIDQQYLLPSHKLLNEVYEHRKNFRSLWKRNHDYHDFLLELGIEAVEKLDCDLIQKKIDKEKSLDLKILNRDLKILKKYYKEYLRLKKRIRKLEKELVDVSIVDEEKARELEKLKNDKENLSVNNLLMIRLGGKIVLITKIFEQETKWVKCFESSLLDEGLNVLIKTTHLSTGINNFYLVDKKNQSIIHKFDRFSLKNRFLDQEVEKFIGFFVFYDINDKISVKDLKEKLILLLLENFNKILTL